MSKRDVIPAEEGFSVFTEGEKMLLH